MKLKDAFITQKIDDDQVMISVDHDLFSGIVHSNGTAMFVIDMLKRGTTKEEILDALTAEYEVDRSAAEKDVDLLLDKLNGIGALEA